MRFDKHIVAFTNTNATRERERESNSQLESLQNSAFPCNDNVISPSLAEGARGWVLQDSASVIASEQSERGNLVISRHCETYEVSRGNLNGIANDEQNTQLAKTRDCHESVCTDSRNDSNSAFASNSRGLLKKLQPCLVLPRVASNARNDNTKKRVSTPKRVSLSLATSALLAAVSLDIAAAVCSGPTIKDGAQDISCSGTMSAGDLTHYMTTSASALSQRTTVNLGSPNLTVNGTAEAQLKFTGSGDKLVIFRRVQARGITFSFDFSNSTSGSKTIYTPMPGYLGDAAGTVIGGLKVTNSSGSATNIYIGGETAILGSLELSGAQHQVLIGGSGGVGQISGNGISRLEIGNSSLGGANGVLLGNSNIQATVNNLVIYGGVAITIDSASSQWNKPSANNKEQHISIAGGCTSASCLTVGANAITVNIGNNTPNDGSWYKLENLVVSGTTAIGDNITQNNINLRNPGVDITFSADGKQFSLKADASTSYGAGVYRALAMSNMRRNTMTQNILDTMTTKTFHSDRFYNQEVELRLLQYDMSRLTNRSSKFSKQTRKNQKKVDKVRERIAKLTLEQSKGQNLDKGYNNFEVIDQLDAIFIPYTGRRDWRFFALPYGTYSYVDLGTSTAQEAAGGALFGMQRNLRANGILGSYIGYEFTNTDTMVADIVPARVQTNSLQAGINYYKTFSVPAKVWEGFIKANIRGGVDLPQLRMNAGPYNLSLSSDKRKGKSTSTIPLMYNIGAELKGGVTFYQFKRNSYISPAVSLSYDMLSSLASKIDKPIDTVGGASYRPLGASEYYDTTYWHLPQLGVDVRYYKMWGNTFRTNLKAGMKYNMLYKQQAKIQFGQTGNLKQTGIITLPVVYGNVAFDLIWMVKKNHELSFGLDALLYASSFAKNNQAALSEWFNGVSGTANFKYAYWFGGTDYVTDKDGNAVARSIAEGGKKSKKSKKPKKKKTKKKKSKVVYIDG